MSIAIIGAGLAGAVCTHILAPHHRCVVFEKSRGFGGRLATRRGSAASWDHGAPCFTARSASFREFLSRSLAGDTLTEWSPKQTTFSPNQKPYKRNWFEPHYVGTPSMNQWLKPYFNDASVLLETNIEHISGQPGQWNLHAGGEHWGPFKWVISTAPVPQTTQIFEPFFSIPSVRYHPVWALLCTLERAPSWAVASLKDSVLERLIINSDKPGRASNPTLVALADPLWTEAHIDHEPEFIQGQLAAAAEAHLGSGLKAISVHRWRYAKVVRAHTHPFWLDRAKQLGACGDWGGEQGAESAFLSATSFARELLTRQ